MGSRLCIRSAAFSTGVTGVKDVGSSSLLIPLAKSSRGHTTLSTSARGSTFNVAQYVVSSQHERIFLHAWECGELMLGIRDYATREKHTCGGAVLNDVY
jgi:hypothetical protein